MYVSVYYLMVFISTIVLQMVSGTATTKNVIQTCVLVTLILEWQLLIQVVKFLIFGSSTTNQKCSTKLAPTFP